MTGPLTQQARALADKVSALALAVQQLDRRTNRSEKVTVGVVFGLLLDLILSVAVALVLANLIDTNQRLQVAIDREAITRQGALCPLYALVVGGYNPATRAEGMDRQQYIAAFDVLRAGYRSLDCTDPIVPPRIDMTPVPTR